MLAYVAIFLAAAVIAVPLAKKLGLGSVPGYLLAGVAIGPSGFGWIRDVQSSLELSEFGVALLLFVIGLELQPARLWRLRNEVFGLGGAQVALTAAVLYGIARGFGLPASAAGVAGFGLAMSSTALVLQMLAERGELGAHQGRASFAILLFQDLAAIGLLALLPMLAPGADSHGGLGAGLLRVAAVVAAVIALSRLLLRPAFRAVAAAKLPELFTAAALLVVIATALAVEAVGLSMALGAFLAGVLLADSEYRHELHADLEPFKGLLMGLFFIAVGMSADLGLLLHRPLLIFALALGLMAAKAALLALIGRIARLPMAAARALGAANAQGGEFAFVLFAAAVAAGLMTAPQKDLLVMVVTLSMALSPALYKLEARLRTPEQGPAYDEIKVAATPVVIAGFGPFGQIVARLLRVKKIAFTVLERDWQQVDFVRRFGNPVFYSDAARPEVLKAAHVDQAQLLVIAIAEQEQSLRVAQTARRHHPELRVFAVARTRRHALALMDLGVRDVVRRSYFSSLELSRQVLLALGHGADRAAQDIATFRSHDETTLMKQQAFAHDEKQLIESAQQSARELEQLFAADESTPS